MLGATALGCGGIILSTILLFDVIARFGLKAFRSQAIPKSISSLLIHLSGG